MHDKDLLIQAEKKTTQAHLSRDWDKVQVDFENIIIYGSSARVMGR